MSGRSVLLLGGTADGQRVTVLYGDTVIMGAPLGDREFYHIVQLGGSTKRFEVGVIAGHHMDGDWIIDRLIRGYGT